MSTGDFTRSKYQANDGKIFPVKLQPETIQLTLGGVANTPPVGDVLSGLPTVKVSTGAREFGVRPRGVVIELTATGGVGFADYAEGNKYRVTVLTEELWDAAAAEQVGTYLGIACKVSSKYPELIK